VRGVARLFSLAALVVPGVLGVLASSSVAGCKKHKPPARTRIWLGPSHACSLQNTASSSSPPGGPQLVECWGANEAGQLGDRTTTSRALPAPVVHDGAITELALGARHTCAISGPNDPIHCWGDGARGQLGTGLATALSAPSVPVIDHGAPLTGATAIAAGGDHSCALTGAGVRCWGDGQLEAQEPAGFHGAASAVAVGPGFVCAAFGEPKTVRCSGADDRGQSAGKQPILPGASIAGMAAGAKHACVLLQDGSIQCWGANDQGQLGDGTTTDSRVPALVHGLPPAAEVRAGANHTCARLRNNTVACWGDNRAHQLVNGTSNPSSKPTPLPGLVGVVELAVGGDSGCARLVTDGAVRCWGANTFGQLGDGTTEPHDVPMPVRAAPLRR
jgi:alpha-tubulin suppressor-like RCC1 family protein